MIQQDQTENNCSGGVDEVLPTDPTDVNVAESFASHHLNDHPQISTLDVHKHPDKYGRILNGKAKITVGPLKSFRWQNGRKTRNLVEDSSDGENEGDQTLHTSASERVKFLLGYGDKEDGKPPHEKPQLFTELEELFVYVDGNSEWKETARWYKYEEDVEESGDRWSKPHVAAISLCSLLELRSSVMAGTVILDMDATSLPDIISYVLTNLVSSNKLEECVKDKVQETLLRKHHHHRGISFRRNLSNIISRRSSSQIQTNLSLSSKLNLYTSLTSGQTKMQFCDSHTDVTSAQIKMCCGDSSSDITSKELPPSETHSNKSCYRNLSQNTTGASNTPVFNRSASIQGHLVYPLPPNDSDVESNEKSSRLKSLLPPNAEASNILVGEVDYLSRPITAFVRLLNSSLIRDLTEVSIPTRFLFFMLGPRLSNGHYHEIGRAISTLMSNDIFHDVAYSAKSKEDLITGIDAFLEQVTVLPPGEWNPSIRIEPQLNGQSKVPKRLITEISKTELLVDQNGSGGSVSAVSDSVIEDSNSNIGVHIRRQCGGLFADFYARKSRVNDIRDGLNVKSFAAAVYIYLLLLSLIATVGDHEKTVTDNLIGVREHLLSFGINGLFFALFSGQPMLVMCYTVPVMMFDKLLYMISQDLQFEFLPLRLWVGVWTAFFLIVCAVLNISNCIQYVTQFTLDIFAVLQPMVLLGYVAYYMCIMVVDISLSPGMFTNHSCFCLRYTYNELKDSNSTNMVPLFINKSTVVDNIHFRDCVGDGLKLIGNACNQGVPALTLLVTVSSVLLLLLLASFQHFGCFPKLVHKLLHDFSSLITVFVASIIVNQFSINILYIQLPANFQPLGNRTSWLVPFFGSNQAWSICVAIIPAIFLTTLLFSEQQLASYYIQKLFILKKSSGNHLDLLVVAIGVLLSSLLGLPFNVTSVIFSVNKIRSLTIIKPAIDLYGGRKEVREQRVTAVLVSFFLLLTPSMRPMLKFIPLSALYAIFIVAMCKVFINNKFTKRFKFLFVPDHQDEEAYLRQVPIISTNIMTLVQVACVVVLWSVRASIASFSFPFAIFFVTIVRFVLEFVLPDRDVQLLDEPRPRFSCFQKKSDSYSHLILDAEQGSVIEGQDVSILSEPKKMMIDIGDELSKTAAWKQLTCENSLVTKSLPKIDTGDSGPKRRRRRSRGLLKANANLARDKNGKECLVLVKNQKSSRKVVSESSKCASADERKSRANTSNGRRIRKKSKNTEEQLPPWEQPFGSPPRKDFGLMEIPEDGLSVDPACSRTDSYKSDFNLMSQKGSPISSRCPLLDHKSDLSPKNSQLRQDLPDASKNILSSPLCESGDASAEEDVL